MAVREDPPTVCFPGLSKEFESSPVASRTNLPRRGTVDKLPHVLVWQSDVHILQHGPATTRSVPGLSVQRQT